MTQLPLFRMPAGVPAGGQFTSRTRPEGPRLRLVPPPAPDLGLDATDLAYWDRLDRLVIASDHGRRPVAMSALDKMTYSRVCAQVDAHVEATGDRTGLPTCPGCSRAWGTSITCRACTNLYGDPLPLRQRLDAGARADSRARAGRPYWQQ